LSEHAQRSVSGKNFQGSRFRENVSGIKDRQGKDRRTRLNPWDEFQPFILFNLSFYPDDPFLIETDHDLVE
jgi:hypothetical protein